VTYFYVEWDVKTLSISCGNLSVYGKKAGSVCAVLEFVNTVERCRQMSSHAWPTSRTKWWWQVKSL